MKRREFLTVTARAAAGTVLLSSTSIVLLTIAGPVATLAQQGMPGGTPMTFFVTSESIGNGGIWAAWPVPTRTVRISPRPSAPETGPGTPISAHRLAPDSRPSTPAIASARAPGTTSTA